MIVFPMAGLSRRFTEAGYNIPKYMLPISGKTCFDYSVMGFLEGFKQETFLFVMRDVFDTPAFVETHARAMGIDKFEIVVLGAPTSGQGETVELGLKHMRRNDESLTVFNIDTFRAPMELTARERASDGFLEVFIGPGDGWSFVEPKDDRTFSVKRTTEKDRISNLCCTGLYYFRSAEMFLHALESERRKPTSKQKETYIAPIYNQMIESGLDVRYGVVESAKVTFCGTPQEYEAINKRESQKKG